MSHGTHTLNQFRTHAEAVVTNSIDSLNPVERTTVMEAYRQQIEALNGATNQDINKLRLAIYANLIDSDHIGNIIESREWILSNLDAAQVLINTLDNNSLYYTDSNGINHTGEDGIIGPMTIAAVQRNFGIDISATVISPSAVVTSTATVGTISSTVNEEGETVYDLPDFMQDEEQIRGMLEQLGINGLRIENGKLIGRMELDTQEKLRKLEEYLDFANYIENEGATGAGKVERYKKLLDDSTDYIWDKQYLIQKYIVSIYKDLLEVGCIIRQNGINGEYVIAGISATPDIVTLTSETYGDVISGPYARTAHIEFARIYGIVESSNNPRFHEQAVSREGLVLHILQNNDIVSDALSPDIQTLEALLLNKDRVIEQLTDVTSELAGEHPQNYNQYQEAIWLLDFLEHEHYKQNDLQRDIFNQVNHYKNIFLHEQSFIDALTAEGVDPNNINPQDEGFINAAQRVLGENTIPIVLLSLVTMLFGGEYKGWGVKGLFGLFAAKVGLGIAESVTDEVTNARDDGGTIGDTFDIFDPVDLRHRINYPDGFNRTEYDPTLLKIYNTNDTRRDSGEIIAGTPILHSTNAKLAKIFQEVMTKDDLLGLNLESSDDNTLVDAILGSIDINISEDTFLSRIPSDQHGEIERDDVRVFIELLRATMEDGDVSLGDALLEGKSIVTESYENQNFTIDNNFDRTLNNHLRARWEANVPSDTISIAEATKGRQDILELTEMIETMLSNGNFDGLFDAGTTLDWDTLHRGLPEQLSNIDTLIAAINGDADLSDDTKNPLIDNDEGILPQLKIYLESTTILAEYENGASNGIIGTIKAWTHTEEEVELQNRLTILTDTITKLSPDSFGANNYDLTILDLHGNIEAAINKTRRELENQKTLIVAKINGIEIAEIEELQEQVRLFQDANTRFSSSSGSISDIFPNQSENIQSLQEAWREVSGGPISANSQEEVIHTLLKPLFETNGEMELLQTNLAATFDVYYAVNSRVINTDIPAINFTAGNINSLNAARIALSTIETDYESELGTYQNFLDFLGGTPISTTEKHLDTARTLFPSLSVTGSTNTLKAVAEAAKDKQREIAQEVFNFVNTLTTADIDDNFDVLSDMTNGIQDGTSILDLMTDHLGDGARDIFSAKFKESALAVINEIPVDASGVNTLRLFHQQYLEGNPSRLARVLNKALLNGDANDTSAILANEVQPAYDAKLTMISNNILSTFGNSINDLRDLIEFTSSNADYLWLTDKNPDLINQAAIKIETLRNNLITSTLTTYTLDDTGLNALITFMRTPEYVLLDSGDGTLETGFNEKAVEIITAMLENTTTYPNTIAGIGALISFKDTDPRYIRFSTPELDTEFERVLGEKQRSVRGSTKLTSTYPDLATFLSGKANDYNQLNNPAGVLLNGILSSNTNLNDVVNTLGLLEDDISEEHNGISADIRNEAYGVLNNDKLI